MAEVGEVGDLVVRDVKYAEEGILLQPGDFGQNIVRDVEFLEVGEPG